MPEPSPIARARALAWRPGKRLHLLRARDVAPRRKSIMARRWRKRRVVCRTPAAGTTGAQRRTGDRPSDIPVIRRDHRRRAGRDYHRTLPGRVPRIRQLDGVEHLFSRRGAEPLRRCGSRRDLSECAQVGALKASQWLALMKHGWRRTTVAKRARSASPPRFTRCSPGG